MRGNRGDALPERHKPSVDEAHEHHCRCRRRLNQCRDEQTGDKSCEMISGHRREDAAQTVAGGFLQTLTHHFHSVEEEADGS